VNQQTNQGIEIQSKPHPLLYGLALFSAASIVLSQPNDFGLVLLLIVLVTMAVWWLSRVQSISISFEPREATFVYSSLNPFRTRKVVSLAGFTRVHASPFYRNNGWAIRLSGPRGEHLLLAEIPSICQPDDYVRSLCVQIASGLRIADGGGG
jgi:hypothetical protein